MALPGDGATPAASGESAVSEAAWRLRADSPDATDDYGRNPLLFSYFDQPFR